MSTSAASWCLISYARQLPKYKIQYIQYYIAKRVQYINLKAACIVVFVVYVCYLMMSLCVCVVFCILCFYDPLENEMLGLKGLS